MRRWTDGGEIERLAMVANGACSESRSATPNNRAVSAKTEREETVRVSIPEGWLDRIQVGFPRANWW